MDWIKKNNKEVFIVILILLFAAFLRLYKVDQYMTFLGDEGRDALMIKRILTTWDIPLLGPPTSIGNMYLGPLYYYMMTIPMAIFWLNPASAAVMVALLGTATVGLIYFLGRVWFGKTAALISAILYAVSPVNIIYSRSSWNPNPAPFFALLILLSLHFLHKSKNFLWLILTGISLAFVVQMHYLALILMPAILVLYLYEVFVVKRYKLKVRSFITGPILGTMSFLLLMSPLLIFDLKHDFMNYKAISTFFTNRETTVNLNIFNTLERIVPIYTNNLVERYITGENIILISIISFLILLPIILLILYMIKKRTIFELPWAYFALSIWLIIGVLGLALYKQNIYDHYLGFLNPIPFLLLGSIAFLSKLNLVINKKIVNIILVVLFLSLLTVNLLRTPLQYPPNNQLQRTQSIAKFVISESGNKPFNFALIAKSNYDDAYEFYLDTFGKKSEKIQDNITEQLFVVCEDPVCEPINHPKFEIAGFGWSKIEKEQEFLGIKVFKLIHNPDQK